MRAGAIPESIGNLTNLQTLNLSDNVQFEKDFFGDTDFGRPIAGTGLSGACVC